MNIVKVLIEFIITFGIVYLAYYVMVIRRCKKNKKLVPTEVNLILCFYDIDLKKINSYQMIKVVCLLTSFIIATIVTVISVFFDSTIIILIFGTLMSILLAIICYRLVGRYYEIQSKKATNSKKSM